MPDYRVIFAGPKFQGNVGAIARAMKNFQINDLYLVNPCEIGDECLSRAKHGKDIVENAKHVETLEEAIDRTSLPIFESCRSSPARGR